MILRVSKTRLIEEGDDSDWTSGPRILVRYVRLADAISSSSISNGSRFSVDISSKKAKGLPWVMAVSP